MPLCLIDLLINYQNRIFNCAIESGYRVGGELKDDISEG